MSTTVDRRKFLERAGAAGAAAGAVWLAPSVLGSTTAFAAGSCMNSARLDWDNLGGGNAPTPNTNYTVTGYAIIPASGTSPSIRVNITVTRVATPGYPDQGAPSGLFNGTLGGLPGTQYAIGMTNIDFSEGYQLKLDFRNLENTQPVDVYNLAYTITDIDRDGSTDDGYQDVVTITPTPTTWARNSDNVSVTGGGSIFTATGGSNVDPSSASGNVALTFAGPVNSTTVQFTSGNRRRAQQAIGVTDLTWCY